MRESSSQTSWNLNVHQIRITHGSRHFLKFWVDRIVFGWIKCRTVIRWIYLTFWTVLFRTPWIRTTCKWRFTWMIRFNTNLSSSPPAPIYHTYMRLQFIKFIGLIIQISFKYVGGWNTFKPCRWQCLLVYRMIHDCLKFIGLYVWPCANDIFKPITHQPLQAVLGWASPSLDTLDFFLLITRHSNGNPTQYERNRSFRRFTYFVHCSADTQWCEATIWEILWLKCFYLRPIFDPQRRGRGPMTIDHWLLSRMVALPRLCAIDKSLLPNVPNMLLTRQCIHP